MDTLKYDKSQEGEKTPLPLKEWQTEEQYWNEMTDNIFAKINDANKTVSKLESDDPEEFDSSDPIHDKMIDGVINPTEDMDTQDFNHTFSYEKEDGVINSTMTPPSADVTIEKIIELKDNLGLDIKEAQLLKDMYVNNIWEDNWMGDEDSKTYDDMILKYWEHIFWKTDIEK